MNEYTTTEIIAPVCCHCGSRLTIATRGVAPRGETDPPNYHRVLVEPCEDPECYSNRPPDALVGAYAGALQRLRAEGVTVAPLAPFVEGERLRRVASRHAGELVRVVRDADTYAPDKAERAVAEQLDLVIQSYITGSEE